MAFVLYSSYFLYFFLFLKINAFAKIVEDIQIVSPEGFDLLIGKLFYVEYACFHIIQFSNLIFFLFFFYVYPFISDI